MDEVFRPKSNYIWAGTALILIFLFAATNLIFVDSISQTFFEFLSCLFLAVCTYLIWIRPKLVLQSDGVEVVNPLHTDFIRYDEMIELDTKWALTIIHNRGKTRVWVAPASGKRKWIADNTFRWYGSNVPLSDNRYQGSETMSSSLDSLSGQAAYMIRERMKRDH